MPGDAERTVYHTQAFLERRQQRELAVLWGVVLGLSSAEIARQTGLHVNTVQHYRQRHPSIRCESTPQHQQARRRTYIPVETDRRFKPVPEGLLEMCRTHTCAETGARFGLSGERVRQLAKKHGVKRQVRKKMTPAQKKVLSHPGARDPAVSNASIARDVGISDGAVRRWRPVASVVCKKGGPPVGRTHALDALRAILATGPRTMKEIQAEWKVTQPHARMPAYLKRGCIRRLEDGRYMLPEGSS